MSLPQSAEYDEAIQNSRSAFIDPELRSATNDGPLFMGVPGGPVASGNFAIVYRFRTGTRRLAVKCFTREKTDQQTRYELIHEHLATQKLPWTIDFNFIKEGIRVKGKTYPIVKMEWIENAKTLLSHVNDAVSAKQPLDSVCDQFYRMSSDLRKHSIAHGDLQHANLIISDGKLLLIDYDGMCVPKTAGLKSEEDGLPDYQHPRRHGGTLQSSMDHFSTLVIWTSLHALTIDPTLWRRWVRDDERLLFCREDFTRPDDSALIRELLSFRDPKMSSAVEAIIKAAAATRLEQVPHLVEVVTGVASLDTTPWWQPAVIVSGQSIPQRHDEPKPLPAWIASSTTVPPQPVVFRGGTPIISFYSAISMGVVLIAGLLGFGGALATPVALTWVFSTLSIYGVVLHVAFVMRPEVASRGNAGKRLSEALADERQAAVALRAKQAPHLMTITDHERKIADSEAKMKKLEEALDAIKKRMADRLQSFAHDQSEKRSRAEKTEREAISQASAKRASAKTSYDSQLRQIEQDRSSAEARFTTQANLLSSQAEQDREAKFAAKFDAFIQAEMAKVEMWKVTVSGASSYELAKFGFHTLADFIGVGYECLKHRDGKSYKIRGIGYVRAQQMEVLRKRMIEKIRLKIPAAERDAINQAIDAETRNERQRLESIRDQVRAKTDNAKLNAKAEHDRTVAEAMRAENEAKQRAKVMFESLSAEHGTFKAKVASEEAAESEPLTRELWSLQSVVNPARHLIKGERIKMQAESLELSRQAAKTREKLEAAKHEVARYAAITHAGLIKHIFS
ncbi:MAG: hypothetical protein IPK32_21720 [Verrucomicrobiaceae bacterium]|nr:hypothetical protein [Verrucomicrobiaceae bacterium]